MWLDLMARNPGKHIPAARQPRSERQPLIPDQVRILLSAIQGHPLQAFFTLLTMTGMRRGEALALHWADIHMNEGYADVKYMLEYGIGGNYTLRPAQDRA
jgi:integrase